MRQPKTVLLLAPHPFYQDRGTPIAVDWVLQALAERGVRVDMVTYHEGRSVRHPGVRIHRIPSLPFIRNIRPGFSFKKVVCDLFLCVKAFQLRARRRYDVTHCVEESVFIGILLKAVFRTPYIYDMDSSLPQQMVERFPVLRPIAPAFDLFERLAVRGASAVVPVCDALASIAKRYRPKRVVLLRDISLLGNNGDARHPRANGRAASAKQDGAVLLYAGNLEPYQGIDLLLESFALARRAAGQGQLLVVGGAADDIARYRERAGRLDIGDHVRFLGPKPVKELGRYLADADILVSPRTLGRNTPMKIYSYLHSGRPILATKLMTHTQVLTDDVSLLAEPSPEPFAKGMVRLMRDRALRSRLGRGGQRLAEERYSYRAFTTALNDLYDGVSAAPARRRNGS